MTKTRLTTAQADRAAGVLLGHACGDALGAGYEFGPPMAPGTPVGMVGGGGFGWEPGEWTDDTQMAVAILEAAEEAQRDGDSLDDHLDTVGRAWVSWARTAADVGVQTSRVLADARRAVEVTAAGLTLSAAALHQETGRSGGNGSLMRTSPVALAHLGADDAIALSARRVSAMTHDDPDAGDACVLWCLAISHAVLTSELDVRRGLAWIAEERRELWGSRITEAEQGAPTDFPNNGWVVHAFQAAWSAITTTPVPALDPAAGTYPAQHLQHALENAVRAGHDTDTVAAIAGQLLGARWGSSGVPAAWRRMVHGWPGLTGADLAAHGLTLARGCADATGWPTTDRIHYAGWGARGRLVPHPQDPGVLLGDAAVLDDLPAEVDAVVSLCRVGRATRAALGAGRHVEVWLIDTTEPDDNPNLDFVLADAADAVAGLRAEGCTVLLHCVAAQSRTPTIGAAYSVLHRGIEPDVALAEVCAALPDPMPNSAFTAAVRRMTPRTSA